MGRFVVSDLDCIQASLQHVDNLSTIIQEGLRQQQLSRVAGASSKLITYLAQAIHPVRKYRLSETQRIMRHLHAVEAGLECLQHPPKPFVGENLVRLLRQVQVREPCLCDMKSAMHVVVFCAASLMVGTSFSTYRAKK